jgi:oligoendopeptidase F
MSKQAKDIHWDLSDLYQSIDDPKIEKDKEGLTKLVDQFIKNYKGKINSPSVSSKLLLQSIKDSEEIDSRTYLLYDYAAFLHSADTKDEKVGKLYQEMTEFVSNTSARLVWYLLEQQKLPEKKAAALKNSPELKLYKHYLEFNRAFAPFKLSEQEEVIITKSSQTGAEAFVRFYDEKLSKEQLELTISGKKKQIPLNQIGPFLNAHKDRKVRQNTAIGLTKVYQQNAHFYTYVLNTLLLDKKMKDEIRGYTYPQQPTFLSYEVSPEIVQAMTSAIQKRENISQKFYTQKAKLLKQGVLHEWDRYSSIYSEVKDSHNWDDAKRIIHNSFSEFDPEFAQIAQEFFDKNWIEAESRANKRTGAYCSYTIPNHHPYVFMNYNDGVGDVSTLAHELGHAIHGVLAKKNSLYNFHPSTATAEIASIFAESITFDYLFKNTTNKKLKINLLADKIQGSFATIFRQNAFYLFELDIHKHRREQGELTTEHINNYYQSRLQPMFGKSLKLTPGHSYWWMNIAHFYHYNFYVFTYAMGEALTNALYAQYKLEGKPFIERYKKALASGGSLSPIEITNMMGVDITDSEFWNKGLDLLEEEVSEFEKLVKSV